jgi:hypothetical protein
LLLSRFFPQQILLTNTFYKLFRGVLGETLKLIRKAADSCDHFSVYDPDRRNKQVYCMRWTYSSSKASSFPGGSLLNDISDIESSNRDDPPSISSSNFIDCSCVGCRPINLDTSSSSFGSEVNDDPLFKLNLKNVVKQHQAYRQSNYKNSDLVLRNFRGLLWYWSEYYLRRGRDRLSIEFSSHIRFQYWKDLVGKFLTSII